MILGLDSAIPLLIQYKYLVIFPIVAIEGPIITIICGLLVSLGYLDFATAIVVVISGDLAGDALYYSVGRFGRRSFIIRYGHWFGVNAEHLTKLENYFRQYSARTFFIGKFSHGVGGIFLVASGVARVPFWAMLRYNVIPTIIKSTGLLLIGFYFGKAYVKIDHILNYAALVVLVVFIGGFILLVKTKFLSKIIDRL